MPRGALPVPEFPTLSTVVRYKEFGGQLATAAVLLVATALAPPIMSGLAFFSLTHGGPAMWAGWLTLGGLSLILGLVRRRFTRSAPATS